MKFASHISQAILILVVDIIDEEASINIFYVVNVNYRISNYSKSL